MSPRSKYLFVVSMDVEQDKERLFNQVYNEEHCPLLSTVPGVNSVARYEKQTLTMILGGEKRSIVFENEPKYHAIYELEDPSVLTSEAWGNVVDAGTWPDQVRPYTRNRRHTLLKLVYPDGR